MVVNSFLPKSNCQSFHKNCKVSEWRWNPIPCYRYLDTTKYFDYIFSTFERKKLPFIFIYKYGWGIMLPTVVQYWYHISVGIIKISKYRNDARIQFLAITIKISPNTLIIDFKREKRPFYIYLQVSLMNSDTNSGTILESHLCWHRKNC